MEKDYKNPKVRRSMYKELDCLMKKGRQAISSGEGSDLYDLATHRYLMEEGWEIMFPLKKELWPNKFNEFLCDENLPWPQYATYSYIMSVLCPPFISSYLLYFGYAIIDGKLVKTTFFAVNTMVEYQEMPQSMVVDPLCLAHGIEPDYYIGCGVGKQDINNFMTLKKNPLELFVKREEEERRKKDEQEHKDKLYISYSENYELQIRAAPGYFPPQLIEFCKENNLYIPPQERKVGL
jgi:hypothetical protein